MDQCNALGVAAEFTEQDFNSQTLVQKAETVHLISYFHLCNPNPFHILFYKWCPKNGNHFVLTRQEDS